MITKRCALHPIKPFLARLITRRNARHDSMTPVVFGELRQAGDDPCKVIRIPTLIESSRLGGLKNILQRLSPHDQILYELRNQQRAMKDDPSGLLRLCEGGKLRFPEPKHLKTVSREARMVGFCPPRPEGPPPSPDHLPPASRPAAPLRFHATNASCSAAEKCGPKWRHRLVIRRWFRKLCQSTQMLPSATSHP